MVEQLAIIHFGEPFSLLGLCLGDGAPALEDLLLVLLEIGRDVSGFGRHQWISLECRFRVFSWRDEKDGIKVCDQRSPDNDQCKMYRRKLSLSAPGTAYLNCALWNRQRS